MAPLLAQRKRADRAFEKLYQRHVGDVYRYALVVTRNPPDAEDVTQTTFLNAYRAFARGERPRTAQNWLIAIAHNVCRQRFRQLQRRPNELPFDEETVEPAADEGSPTAEDIRRALGHLAFNQRAALVMRELEGRSYAEIAEVLQLSTSAVETLLFRARRALREQLEGSITCTEAELAISRQLDGRLPRKEKGPLRAHLRECEDCARFARSQRAQRSAIRSLVLIPVPSSLTSFFHHGAGATAGAAAGSGVAMKAAIVGASAIVATGVGVEAAHKAGFHPLRKHHAAAPAPRPTPQTQPPRARPASLAPPAPVAPVLAPPTPTPPHRQASPPKQAEHGLGAKAAAVARGRANAPGQLQAKPAKHAKHARPAKPTVPPGQAKKAARAQKPDKPKAQNAARPRRASVVKPKAARPAHPAVKPKPTHKAKAKAKPKLQPPPKPSPAPKADHSQKR